MQSNPQPHDPHQQLLQPLLNRTAERPLTVGSPLGTREDDEGPCERAPDGAQPTIVLKFGSSVLRKRADLPAAVQEIYRWYRSGWHVIAVVSALGDTTERLLQEAHALAASPEPFALAELLATGERQAAMLLTMALDRDGLPARAVDPRDIGFTAAGDVLDSDPVLPDAARVQSLLKTHPILVVPGFFAHSPSGRLHLLGRGGSDLSAVCLAQTLGAQRCRLLKDVDGVYEADPAVSHATRPRRYSALDYSHALAKAGRLIQPKAVRFLEHHSATAEIATPNSYYESVVGSLQSAYATSPPIERSRVLLLGAGTVGYGVYQRLQSVFAQFEIAGVLVRDRARYADKIAEEHLCLWNQVFSIDADIVVDALPGPEPSFTLVRHFLGRGVDVVTANKQLIATAGPELLARGVEHGAQLRYSAAVGGGAPMIETLRRETMRGKEPLAIAGVLNSTCNYVLERCVAGASFEEAVKAARAAGFAEADPREDLSGRDALRKLRILARHAFGSELLDAESQALNAASISSALASLQPNQRLRQIARAQRTPSGLTGGVRLEAIDYNDPLAAVSDEWNLLTIRRTEDSAVLIRGRGAGRWPTTTAVIADLLDVRQISPIVHEQTTRRNSSG